MMVDYSPWLATLPYPIPPILWIGAGVIFGVIGFRMWNEGSSILVNILHRYVTPIVPTVISVLSICVCSGFIVFGGYRLAVDDPETTNTFTAQTERTFDISHLRCNNRYCSGYSLPMDGTPASWLKNDRYEKGTIIVNGNKVGLARSNGELLSPESNY